MSPKKLQSTHYEVLTLTNLIQPVTDDSGFTFRGRIVDILDKLC